MIILLALLLGADPTPIQLTHPQWSARPNGDDIAAAYPKDALAKGVNGRAVIDCAVDARGALGDCHVVSETPPDAGFGAATLSLAPTFRMKPATADGVATAGRRITIPLTWRLSDDSVADPAAFHRAERCMGITSADVQAAAKPVDAMLIDFTFWRMRFIEMAMDGGLKPSEIVRRMQAARGAGAGADPAERQACAVKAPEARP